MALWLRKVTGRFRFKVLLATICAVSLVSLIGWIGLTYTNQVATEVTVTTDTNLPLLGQAVQASEAMRTLTRAARNLLAACEVADGSHERLFNGTLASQFVVIDQLADFLGQSGFRDNELKVRSAKDELHLAIDNLSALCNTRFVLQSNFSNQRQLALTLIETVGNRIDERVSRLPPSSAVPITETPTEVAAAATSVEQWAMAVHLARLQTQLVHLSDVLAEAHTADVIRGTSKQDVHELALNRLNAEFELLKPLLIRQDDELRHSLADNLERLTAAILGPAGMHDFWRRVRLFDSGTAIQTLMVVRSEIALSATLARIEDQARLDYQQALTLTKAKINEARWVVGALGGLASVVLLVAGLWFASRLIRPVERLTSHVERLRAGEAPGPIAPDPLVTRTDEIGSLAVAFDRLMEELETARHRLEEESQTRIRLQYDRLSAAIESIPQGLCLTDAAGRLLMSNRRFLSLYELDPQQVKPGMAMRDVLELCRNQGANWTEMSEATGTSATTVLPLQPQMLDFRDEKTIVVRVAQTPEGGSVSVHEDITERRQQEARISQLTHHDSLTGLINRTLFREEVSVALDQLDNRRGAVLMYLDLDNFKLVNESLGHPIGDQLLVLVTERLRQCLHESDQIARLGGDEFAILSTRSTRQSAIARTAEAIIHRLESPFSVEGHTLIIGVSIGIALVPIDGTDPDTLLKHADIALFRAKEAGGNSYRFFKPEMDEVIHARRTLELDLRLAIENNELALFYQPQMGLESQTVEGFEALLRWNHKERGYVSPEEFVAVAEETGLINSLGNWVLRQACQDALMWPNDILIAINLSPLQFRNEGLLAEVEEALAWSGINPQRLEFEITESILLDDTDHTLDVLEAMRRLGVKIALDDFGTGYSSFAYFRKFKFDKVKIDRSFISGMTTQSDSRAVVHAICSLCSSLGIETIAEGVESVHEVQVLKREGCTQGQGYLYSAAVPISNTLSFFEEGRDYYEHKRYT